MKHAVAVVSVVFALASIRPAHGQSADPKTAFFESVARFSTALERQRADAGAVRGALDAMSRALQQWDAVLRSSEQTFAANLPGSPAAAAARMHVAIGAAFLDRGRLSDALREFAAGSRLDPARADVFTFQGVAYDQLARDVDRAGAAFRQSAALDPLNAVRAYSLARALGRNDKEEEALAAYRAVLRLWRRDVDEHAPIAIDTPFIRLGLAQERAGVDPFFPLARYAEGFSLLKRGELAEAIDAFNRAVAEDALKPSDERALVARADALEQERQYPEAEAAFREALKTFPSSGRAHYRLGRLYQRQNKTLEALAEYETAAKLEPFIGSGRLLQAIGALHAAQQSFDAALEAYSARVDVTPNDADAHRTLGYLYSRLDRRDEAFAEFAIALSIAPGLSDVHVAMSQLYLKGADYEAAAGAARRAIALSPTNKQARYSLATALMRLGKPDEAKPEFDAFERLQAEDTAASARQMTINGLRREAADAVNTRDYERAIAVLRKALEVSPGAPGAFEVHEQLASAYAALGRREESERELATARQLRGDALLGEANR